MTPLLTLEYLGHTAIVTMNHPPANLMTVDSLQALSAQLTALQADASIRALVLTGAGDTFFSAGLSLTLLATGDPVQAEALLDALIDVCQGLRAFHGVTVAAVNGFALGAGLECALSCHFIVAERGAMLGMPQARVGLISGAGGIKRLTDKVGQAWARRLVLAGESVDAERACQIGLVEEVVDAGFAKIVAISLAEKVARQGPQAVALAQGLIDAAPQQSRDEHLQQARLAYLQAVGGEELRLGVKAFLDKRSPPWDDDEV
ncbi:MAG: enoyl-CoA hydratase/isomerase family protein [Paludibacterium sp.]|uniref:enoyl-CoA hydratase-related protein n=1 Tax=Paludibacterium sp. TaxID=1917523 RepID=UPI0025EA2DDD|nr:enoyl-CoA hydratase-related protein [Paludibacterium sp.]MBV8048852.1 enoyl-CoA hydratase/isomerase family protein [Paludibacterium sp.]MBV8646491.1 enoyl-CoA hydratase/isomerase family protein [Paludibacterium sp.]